MQRCGNTTSSLVEVTSVMRALENSNHWDDRQKQGSVAKVKAKWVSILNGSSSPTGPPSAPQNLSFSASGTQLSLRWEPPRDTGGRHDVRYSVECLQCRGIAQDGGPCQPCGKGVHFTPGASGLTESTVQVEGLEPYANYTFTIKSQNRVSGLDSSSPSSASLSINMGHAGEEPGASPQTTGMSDGPEAAETQLKLFLLSFRIQPCHSGCLESLSGLSLRLVKKEPRQLELAWAGSRPRNPGGNLSYELHVLNQVRINVRKGF